jgi:hypothetical protein
MPNSSNNDGKTIFQARNRPDQNFGRSRFNKQGYLFSSTKVCCVGVIGEGVWVWDLSKAKMFYLPGVGASCGWQTFI